MRAHWAAALTLVLAGTALVVTPAVAGPTTCQGEQATLVGSTGPDTLEGTPKRDVIVGLAGDDVIYGKGGDDLICAGNGSDRVVGGPGADRLYGGLDRLGDDTTGRFLLGDVLDGGEGDDLLVGVYDDRRVESHRLPDTVSYTDAPAGVVVDLSGTTGVGTGQGADEIRFGRHVGVWGSAFADTITGSDGVDRLEGRLGDDTLRGGDGDDIVYGEGSGAESGDDFLVGGRGDDLLGSYAGRDDIRGSAGDDFVEAYSDRPTRVAGNQGADYIAQNITAGSGSGSDGGGGRDVLTLYGSLLADSTPRPVVTIDLRAGTTSVSTDPAGTGTIGDFEEHRLVGDLSWRFHGTPLADRVWAITGGPLRAWTYRGADWIRGTPRDDFLHGGGGTDDAIGGGGHDTCRSIERGGC